MGEEGFFIIPENTHSSRSQLEEEKELEGKKESKFVENEQKEIEKEKEELENEDFENLEEIEKEEQPKEQKEIQRLYPVLPPQKDLSVSFLKNWLAEKKICSAECALNTKVIAWLLTHPEATNRMPTLIELDQTDRQTINKLTTILEKAALNGEISSTKADEQYGAKMTQGLFKQGETLYYVLQNCTEDCENPPRYKFSIIERGNKKGQTQRKKIGGGQDKTLPPIF